MFRFSFCCCCACLCPCGLAVLVRLLKMCKQSFRLLVYHIPNVQLSIIDSLLWNIKVCTSQKIFKFRFLRRPVGNIAVCHCYIVNQILFLLDIYLTVAEFYPNLKILDVTEKYFALMKRRDQTFQLNAHKYHWTRCTRCHQVRRWTKYLHNTVDISFTYHILWQCASEPSFCFCFCFEKHISLLCNFQ